MAITRPAKWWLAIAGLILATGCSTMVERPAGADVTAIVGVSVIPMTDSEAMLLDQTVIVRGKSIESVGPAKTIKVPAGARRIDGEGRFLIPGLADMHVHLEHIEDPAILQLFVANGVTTVRNMDGRPFVLDWKRRVDAGELVGPAIVTAGPIIDGKPPLRDDNLSVSDAASAAAAVNAQADAGYDFVKLYTNLTPPSYRAAVLAAAKRGLPVSGHVPSRVDVREAIASQRSIEHLAGYGELLELDGAPGAGGWHWSKLYLAQPIDEARLSEIPPLLKQSGTWTVPTLIQAERAVGTVEQVESWLSAPELAAIPADARDFWLNEVRRNSARLDSNDWPIVERGRRNRLALVAALHAGDAPLLAGTDTPNPFVVPGAALHQELALLVTAGLTPGEALLAATRNPARYMGQEGRWGTVEPGRRADVVLLEANPLDFIANTRRQAGVMRAGRWFDRAELERMARALSPPPTN